MEMETECEMTRESIQIVLVAQLRLALQALPPLPQASLRSSQGSYMEQPQDNLAQARALTSGRVWTRDGRAKVWASIEKRKAKDGTLRLLACFKFQQVDSSVQQLTSMPLDGTDAQVLNLARAFKALVGLAASLTSNQILLRLGVWWTMVPHIRKWAATHS
jgi:hypothetical protein